MNPFPVDVAAQPDTAADRPAPADAPVGTRCARQADCDDGFPCTDDACIAGGVCEHVTNDRLCAAGQRCFEGRGCASGTSCTANAQCDDHVACTQDLCAAGGVCQNVRDDSRCADTQHCSATMDCVAIGRCGGDPDCDDGVFCNGPERCVSTACQPGTAPSCADTDPCTADLCSESMRACTHPPVSPCGGTITPGVYALAPGPTYTCGAGSFGPIASVTLAVSAAAVTVTGFPVTLTGTAPAMGMFSASGVQSQGGCQWNYTLSGAFTSPNHFQGTWNLQFDFCSVTNRCFSQFGEVTGTMR